jgi:hypothetical protein
MFHLKEGLGCGRIRNTAVIIPAMMHVSVIIIVSPVDASPESKSTASEAEVPVEKNAAMIFKKETKLH